METSFSGHKSFNLFLSNTNYNILPNFPTTHPSTHPTTHPPTHPTTHPASHPPPHGESRETQLSTSYNLLAKQLHDTECHVIQLRRALSDMRTKLMESRDSTTERFDQLHCGMKDRTRMPGISKPSHTLSDILNDGKSPPKIDSPLLHASSSSSSSSSSSPRQPGASNEGPPPPPPHHPPSTHPLILTSSLTNQTSSVARRICDVDELLRKIEARLRSREDYEAIRQAINDVVQENTINTPIRYNPDWVTYHQKFRGQQAILPCHPPMANFPGNNFMVNFLPDFYRYATQHRITFQPQIIDAEVQQQKERQSSSSLDAVASIGAKQICKNLLKVGTKPREVCLNAESKMADSCPTENPEVVDTNGSDHDPLKNTSTDHAGFNLSNGAIQTPWDSTHRLVANELRSGDEVDAAPKEASLIPSVQSLDTAEVAQRIREILSAHNIGQRLFARHVLGLSQGTVSELLSKPKHWDKLTEKGRESYRRMFLWAANENNITTLKSFAPKKGTNVVMSNNDADDTETEEKIAQILSEAKVAMQMKSGSSLDESASTMVANIYYQELARLNQGRCSDAFLMTKDKNMGRALRVPSFVDFSRQKRPDSDPTNETLNRNVVAQIYQEELRKLAETAEMDGNADDASLYRREIARISEVLNQNKLKFSHEVLEAAPSSEASDDKENNFGNQSGSSSFAGSLVKIESYSQSESQKSDENDNYGKSSTEGNIPQDLRMNKTGFETSEASKLKYSFNYMQGSCHGSFKGKDAIQDQTVSPLQQMQSIASSLLIKSQRPLRAVLPPITQEQLDTYSEIDTEELVKKVKDLLSQYSISQRLFGEMVLGLSQGSVSDLLARPKPWLMLTQKGREPFIRMQIFLDDETAITKLVAAQFQTPAEKLLRMSNHADLKGIPKLRHSPQNSTTSPHHLPNLISSIQYGNKYLGFLNHDPIHFRSSKLASNLPNSFLSGHASENYFDKPIKYEPTLDMKGPFDMYSGSNMFLPKTSLYSLGFYQPSTLRIPQFGTSVENDYFPNLSMPKSSDTTQDLDTFEITTKVKEVLQFHNLGQKLFGEAVLGLSQGSVSELLSKPKPWHMLSLKGREPFLKMHMWLLDPLSINRLKIYQDQIKTKKRKSATDESSLNDIQQKKTRVFFSEEQKQSLRQAYATDPYPSQTTLDELASDLGVATKTVINWFHNYRMRAKQQLKSSNSCSISTSMASHPDDIQAFGDKMRDEIGSFGSDEDCLDQEITVDDDINDETMSHRNSVHSENKDGDFKTDESDFKMDDVTTLIKNEEHDSTYDSIEIGSCMLSSVSGSKQVCSNKRKSAKPQWVYEGTQLVKSLYEASSSESKALEEVRCLGLNDEDDLQPNDDVTPDQ